MSLQPQMRSFLETYPFPTLAIQTDEQFTLTGVNQAYLNNLGLGNNEKELFGWSLFRLYPENKELRKALEKVIETREALETAILMPETAIRGNGQDDIRSSPVLTPLLCDSGEVELIICSFPPTGNHKPPSREWPQHEPQQNPETDKLKKRIREQSCLYRISSLNVPELSIGELLEETVRTLPDGFQSSEAAEASVEYDGNTYATDGYRESKWTISAEKEIRPGINLTVTVAYLKEQFLPDGEPVLEEKRYLVDSVLHHLSLKIDQKLSQQELKEKQQLLDKAYRLARIGIWEFNMQTHELQWSNITKEVHGFSPDYEPDVESTINLFKEGVNRQQFAEAARGAIEEEKPFDVELKIISGQGDERWIRATGEPEYKNGVCTRFYGISQNVTDRRKAEEELFLNEQRFRSLVQDGSDLLAILDGEAVYEYVSPTSESILGIPAEDLIGTSALDYIHHDDRDRIGQIIGAMSPGDRRHIAPFRFRNADGDWRWIETTLTNLTEDPAVGGLVANSRDVTSQKRQQKKILEALREKETLLAEIHHRVKNNLAVVSGMMQLQITEADNTALTDRLLDSIVRIKTMANIHDHLYQSKSFSELKFDENIRSLVTDIHKTLETDTQVRIHFDCEAVRLDINQAIPCSLIVNEVVTNIFKHAFPNRENGNICITLTESDANNNTRLQLTIEDDGIGMPPDFNKASSGSLGLNLIGVLSQQLEAEYHFNSAGEGTSFHLHFQKDSLKGIGNSLF